MNRHITIAEPKLSEPLRVPPEMTALVIGHTPKIREEPVSQRVPERREPHDGVPGEVDGVELDVRQVVQHVRVQRHPHLLVRGDLLLRHHGGLVGPGGMVGSPGLAHWEPGGPPGEGGVGEPRLGEGVGGGQHEGPHLRQRRPGAGASFGRARLVGVRGAGAIRTPCAEVAGRRPSPGMEARPWERRGGGRGAGGEKAAGRMAARQREQG
uniref:Uncharacterized protein n=1 Tax=Arundo donax TaxID=35708 RepID=A0A0A9GJM3_ARUDO